ncbi:hypothetical protein AOG23_02140 [Rhizobium acidisoli]|nr:hypothetical protein AOG23_02140 [Rhizobium acidisoli]
MIAWRRNGFRRIGTLLDWPRLDPRLKAWDDGEWGARPGGSATTLTEGGESLTGKEAPTTLPPCRACSKPTPRSVLLGLDPRIQIASAAAGMNPRHNAGDDGS